MHKFTKLIFDDMKPALGVTEPAAIALACAKARSLTAEKVLSVTVRVNSGIYKNAFTCGIPGTSEVGNEYSAALGIVCGNADKGLCVLEDVNDEAVAAAQELIDSGAIKVELDSISSVLFIGVSLETEHDICIAQLRGGHTNFCHIEKNGEVLLHKEYTAGEESRSPIVECSIAEIFDYAANADIDELRFMAEAYRINNELAN